jgi:hypothetical protein
MIRRPSKHKYWRRIQIQKDGEASFVAKTKYKNEDHFKT